ncbi:hypothetical protein BGZ49_003778 [Haplosporangium sp. Z 27]|nr:hypothetical protein BGZ49_003778 [Haplosporangium sp. Z 27]
MVLDGLLLEYWERRYPDEAPKPLSRLTLDSATNNCLGAICADVQLYDFLVGGNDAVWSEIHDSVLHINGTVLSGRSTGQFWEHCRINKCLGDLLESIFGAVYVDSGFSWVLTRHVFDKLVAPVLDSHVALGQLWVHPRNILDQVTGSICRDVDVKRVTLESDPIHTFEVQIHGVTLTSSTDSKEEWAKRLVAQQALDILAQDPKLLRRMCNCGASKRT